MNDLFLTNELCKRHDEWKKKNQYGCDYLTKFYNNFEKVANKTRLSFIKELMCTVKQLFRRRDYRRSFCDITNYLNYIKTSDERIICIMGLWMFQGFGGVVRIGCFEYSITENATMDKEILKRTNYIS